ncbi:MAG: chalcone isomerase family protein [Gammaproteobacteria bacterium]
MRYFNFVILTLLLAFASNIHAEINIQLPEIVTNEWPLYEKQGEAKFKKLGLHIYDASLWKLSKNKSAENPNTVTALSIVYARNINANRLLSSTHKEWKRLGFAQQYPIDAWLRSLEEIWPDIQKNDLLVFISNEDGDNQFYSGTEILGSVDDPRFASAFLDIWLSENAKYQKHRKELLGEIQ